MGMPLPLCSRENEIRGTFGSDLDVINICGTSVAQQHSRPLIFTRCFMEMQQEGGAAIAEINANECACEAMYGLLSKLGQEEGEKVEATAPADMLASALQQRLLAAGEDAMASATTF